MREVRTAMIFAGRSRSETAADDVCTEQRRQQRREHGMAVTLAGDPSGHAARRRADLRRCGCHSTANAMNAEGRHTVERAEAADSVRSTAAREQHRPHAGRRNTMRSSRFADAATVRRGDGRGRMGAQRIEVENDFGGYHAGYPIRADIQAKAPPMRGAAT